MSTAAAGGSSVTTGTANPPFTAFAEKDPINSTTTLQYQSISAMPQYNTMSFEVSRPVWDLYHCLTRTSRRSSDNKITSKVARPQELSDRRHLALRRRRSPRPVCLANPHNSLLQQVLPSEASVTPVPHKEERQPVSVPSDRTRRPQQELVQRACLAVEEAPSAKQINNSRSSRLGLAPLANLNSSSSNNNNSRALVYLVAVVRLVPISRNPHSVCPCLPCSHELLY